VAAVVVVVVVVVVPGERRFSPGQEVQIAAQRADKDPLQSAESSPSE